MRIAILVTHRGSSSGGLVKHLAEVVPRWRLNPRVASMQVFVLEGTMPDLQSLGVPIQRLPRRDCRQAFRQMAGLVAASGSNVAFNTNSCRISRLPIPLVIMERNIEPIQSPAYTMPLLWRLRLWALRRQHWQACRQATRILAVSNYVREQLQINFSIEEEKIDIVYHGFDMRETKMERRPKIPLPEEPFIFGAGSLIPYRGYEDIIRTVALLKRQGESCPPVVLAGVPDGPARAYARWIRQLPATLGVSKQITWANQLSQAEMTWCYRHARMFVQTSRAEACPNILLEALGHGCIVVSCTQQPMPEIQGESAIFYRTGDATELAPRILQVCAMSRDDAQAMQEKARQRARLFSWDKTAECTLDVLERAISSFNCVRGSHPTARSERHKLHPLHVV